MTIDEILQGLSPEQSARVSLALSRLEKYEREQTILKSELADLRSYGLNQAIDIIWLSFFKEPFVYGEKWKTLSQDEHRLAGDLMFPAIHTICGYLKRARAAEKAAGPMRTRMIEILEVLAPITQRVDALKVKIGKRPPCETKTSIARAERDAKVMTCQICRRPIMAETGVIAHHGYIRPWAGQQTLSCEGARQLPFEVDREALARHLEDIKKKIELKRDFIGKVCDETVAISWTFLSGRANGDKQTKQVTRATFEAVKSETNEYRSGFAQRVTFDDLKISLVERLEREIRELDDYRNFQQKTHDRWPGPSHRRDGNRWVRLVTIQDRDDQEHPLVPKII